MMLKKGFGSEDMLCASIRNVTLPRHPGQEIVTKRLKSTMEKYDAIPAQYLYWYSKLQNDDVPESQELVTVSEPVEITKTPGRPKKSNYDGPRINTIFRFLTTTKEKTNNTGTTTASNLDLRAIQVPEPLLFQAGPNFSRLKVRLC